jgi:thiosulfate reductase cytochrome b subunit
MTTTGGAARRRTLIAGTAAVGAAALAVGVVLLARWLRADTPVADFVAAYPGVTALPAGTPAGVPAWLGWQHFLNAFFLVLLVRSGLLIRTTRRPEAYWTRRTRRRTASGAPGRHSINHWLHFMLDGLWIANGVVFVILLVATGRWPRIVPVDPSVVPHAISVAVQYASLDWPAENGWVHYNALQVLAYFVTVFLAAPLAALTGLRMSPLWPRRPAWLGRTLPVALARRLHFPVMLYFVVFTVVHVTLVLATGAVRNLNHMYASRDDEALVGLLLFAGSVALTAAAWVLARPVLLRPLARLTGTVSR